MDIGELFRVSLMLETAVAAFMTVSIYVLEPSQNSYFGLYELFGVIMAVMLATSGIYWMRELT